MDSKDFIKDVLSKEFDSLENMKKYYNKMSKIYDDMSEAEKETIRNSMCLEMFDIVLPKT